LAKFNPSAVMAITSNTDMRPTTSSLVIGLAPAFSWARERLRVDLVKAKNDDQTGSGSVNPADIH
jgi:hypothetical protein